MAIPIASLHIHSISLPSTSHPLDASIEDHLRRLRASQAGPSSSSSVCLNLFGVKDLYEIVSDLISLPHNQTALSKGKVEEVREGSLALLDASGCALDAVSQMKESILDLQSSIRRGDSDKGIHAYLVSRKKISRMISKCLEQLKKSDNNHPSMESDDSTMKMLKEAQAICLSTLKLVLAFVMGKKTLPRTHKWSVMAKLVKSKHICDESYEAGEVEDLDRSVHSISEEQMGVETKVLLKQLQA